MLYGKKGNYIEIYYQFFKTLGVFASRAFLKISSKRKLTEIGYFYILFARNLSTRNNQS